MALSKIGSNQIDTAATPTVAEATVTGDLTVDTNTLHVDSTNNRVGIGTTSPATATGGGIDIERAAGASVRIDDTTNSVTGELQVYSAGMNLATVTNHDAIISTNNTERLRIDASGRVTIPNQPSFQARSNISNLALTGYAGTTAHLNAFNVEYFDIGNNYDTSTSTYTAPVAGRYYFYVQLQVNGPTTSDHSWGINLHFQVNGAGNHANGYQSLSTSAGSLFGAYGLAVKENILNLSANDTIRVALSGNANINAGSIETATNDGRCRFGGHLLG